MHSTCVLIKVKFAHENATRILFIQILVCASELKTIFVPEIYGVRKICAMYNNINYSSKSEQNDFSPGAKLAQQIVSIHYRIHYSMVHSVNSVNSYRSDMNNACIY